MVTFTKGLLALDTTVKPLLIGSANKSLKEKDTSNCFESQLLEATGKELRRPDLQIPADSLQIVRNKGETETSLLSSAKAPCCSKQKDEQSTSEDEPVTKKDCGVLPDRAASKQAPCDEISRDDRSIPEVPKNSETGRDEMPPASMALPKTDVRDRADRPAARGANRKMARNGDAGEVLSREKGIHHSHKNPKLAMMSGDTPDVNLPTTENIISSGTSISMQNRQESDRPKDPMAGQKLLSAEAAVSKPSGQGSALREKAQSSTNENIPAESHQRNDLGSSSVAFVKPVESGLSNAIPEKKNLNVQETGAAAVKHPLQMPVNSALPLSGDSGVPSGGTSIVLAFKGQRISEPPPPSAVKAAVHEVVKSTATVLEVGIASGVHGGLKIRAELTNDGRINASVSSPSHSGQQMLRNELSSMTTFLRSEDIKVSSLTVREMAQTSSDGSLPGESTSGMNRNQSDQQQRGESDTSPRGMSKPDRDGFVMHDGSEIGKDNWLIPMQYARVTSWLSVMA